MKYQNFNQYSKQWGIVVFCCILGGVGIFLGWGFIQNINAKMADGTSATLTFLPIERGDAFYIRTPHGSEILWDGGEDMSVLRELAKHRPFWDRYIDVWIISHPDRDHYYGGIEVLKRMDIGTIMLTGVAKNDPKYHEMFSLAKQKGTKIVFAYKETDLVIDEVRIDTLFPFTSIYGSVEYANNNFSLVQKVSFGSTSVLLTGDIEHETEQVLLEHGIDISADVLKVPHHGSKSSSSPAFIEAVNPQKAVFTVGSKNRFGHPHQEVLDRYTKMGIPFWNTQDGAVVIQF